MAILAMEVLQVRPPLSPPQVRRIQVAVLARATKRMACRTTSSHLSLGLATNNTLGLNRLCQVARGRAPRATQ